jgi:hypothetical protein
VKGTLLVTYSMEQSSSWEVNRFSTSQEIPTFYGTRRFITAFTSVRHLPLSFRSYQNISPGPRLTVWLVRNMITFLRRGDVSTSPNPPTGGPSLVGCPRLLIQYIRSYLPYWRPFLHPQNEDGPYRGDRDPLTTVISHTRQQKPDMRHSASGTD